MGDVPDWYQAIAAAKYLGVAPWDLLEQPQIWTDWALSGAGAEGGARKSKETQGIQTGKG